MDEIGVGDGVEVAVIEAGCVGEAGSAVGALSDGAASGLAGAEEATAEGAVAAPGVQAASRISRATSRTSEYFPLEFMD